jgi:hypothetical protein
MAACEFIADEMTNNEALRRILWYYQQPEGILVRIAEAEKKIATDIAVFNIQANDPPARLVPPNDARLGLLIRNMDNMITAYYGSSPDVDQNTGAVLRPGESVPLDFVGPIYAFASAGNPLIQVVELT